MTASGVSVRFDDVFKAFDETVVLAGVSLTVAPGEIFALLGPSGSGKTTMLRLLAGFEQLDRGRLLIADQPVEQLPPARRGVGMLFQSYALFPHLTVAQNVAFGLKARGRPQGEIDSRVGEMLELVRLSGFGSRRIAELSGGQQQRVALARALAPRPRVLLLDEPLSNLDPALREETRADLRRTVKQTGITTVLVTHEQEEAFELGERVGLLNDGRLEQVARPAALYGDPASRFVATFVGRCSVLPGVVLERAGDDVFDVLLAARGGSARGAESGQAAVRQGATREHVGPHSTEERRGSADGMQRDSRHGLLGSQAEVWRCRGGEGLEAGASVDVCVRPESLELAASGEGLTGEIEAERFTGGNSFYTVRLIGLTPGREGSDQVDELSVAGASQSGAQAPDGRGARPERPPTVEVAMPGSATGWTGACVVRQRVGEPPPCVFAAEAAEDDA